jgi:hypothetical protein
MSKDKDGDDSPLEIVWSKPNDPTTWNDTDLPNAVEVIKIVSSHSNDVNVWSDIRFLKTRTYCFDKETAVTLESPKAEKITENGHFVLDCADAIWFIPDTWVAMRNVLKKELQLEFENPDG